MRGSKLVVLMGLIGAVIVTPASAWTYVNVGVSYGPSYVYEPPVVVEPAPVVVAPAPVVVAPAPVVVERPVVYAPVYRSYSYCAPVVYPRSGVRFSYWGGHCGPRYYHGHHGHHGSVRVRVRR